MNDGRNIDSSLGVLSGEGSEQHVSSDRVEGQTQALEVWTGLPEPPGQEPTYYDRPLLKQPVWKWDIPSYYFLGGAAGAALALGAASQFRQPALYLLMKRCHWIGVIASSLGGALLIHDLGRPERFLAMMRVFRPTSPMNMGVWILSSAAPLGVSAAVFGGRRGLLGGYGKSANYGAGLFGVALATYTGVLVSNTAIPVWYQSRRVLPILFGGSGMASAVSILDLFPEDPASSRVRFLCGTAGRITELAAGVAMERQVAKIPQVARPLRTGASGFLWRTAMVLTATSLVISMLPAKGRWKRQYSGAFGILGSVAMRFAVHFAGVRSSRDPRASFQDQRSHQLRHQIT